MLQRREGIYSFKPPQSGLANGNRYSSGMIWEMTGSSGVIMRGAGMPKEIRGI
jgi:hypothetical protein